VTIVITYLDYCVLSVVNVKVWRRCR